MHSGCDLSSSVQCITACCLPGLTVVLSFLVLPVPFLNLCFRQVVLLFLSPPPHLKTRLGWQRDMGREHKLLFSALEIWGREGSLRVHFTSWVASIIRKEWAPHTTGDVPCMFKDRCIFVMMYWTLDNKRQQDEFAAKIISSVTCFSLSLNLDRDHSTLPPLHPPFIGLIFHFWWLRSSCTFASTSDWPHSVPADVRGGFLLTLTLTQSPTCRCPNWVKANDFSTTQMCPHD